MRRHIVWIGSFGQSLIQYDDCNSDCMFMFCLLCSSLIVFDIFYLNCVTNPPDFGELGVNQEVFPYAKKQIAFISNTKCSGIKNRTNHIDVSYHFIKDLVRDKSVYLKYCPSEEMTADALTKPLGNILFLKYRIGIVLGSIFGNNSDSVAHNQSD